MKRREILLLVLGAAVVLFAYERWQDTRRQKLVGPDFNGYTLIEPGLYVGGNASALPPGVSAVLCLTVKEDSYHASVEQWQPIRDASPPPSLEWLRKQVLFIDTQRRAGLGVYIHCDAGVSRSPMVVAAYLMWRDHLTRDQSLQRIRDKRPMIYPNNAFMGLLLEWQRSLGPAI